MSMSTTKVASATSAAAAMTTPAQLERLGGHLRKLRWQKTGSVAPAQMGGHRKVPLHGREAQVRDLVTSQPDITLAKLCAAQIVASVPRPKTSHARALPG